MATHPDNANLPVSNRPETVLGVTITFLGVALCAISLRMYVRIRERLFGWDDAFVLLAGVSTVVGSSLTCLMPQDGLGKHFWTLDEHTVKEYFKHIWATNVTYSATTTFIKLAILLQYLRLFDRQQHVARKLTWGLLVVVAMWGITFTLLALFSCRPIAKNWDFELEGTCVAWGSKDPNVFFASWVAHSASNMLWDILILLLPIPFIRQLRMTGKTRLGLIALFTMGGIVVTLSIARVIALSIRRVGTVPVFDPTYATPTVYIFSVLEINVAILTASIPIFWPLVASLSMNNILVVNEIDIRTERRQSGNIALTEQASAKSGFTGEEDLGFEDGRVSSASVTAGRTEMDKLHRAGSRLGRSLSRQHRSHHRAKPSTASSLKDLGISIGVRASQDSDRNFNLSHQTSNNSFSSMHREQGSPLAPSPDKTVARYADRYMQDWAVPDFDRGVPVSGGANTYTTTVERAEIPYDHIKALEK